MDKDYKMYRPTLFGKCDKICKSVGLSVGTENNATEVHIYIP